jgi:glycosyltransferase involved in cell wall biosynthesis
MRKAQGLGLRQSVRFRGFVPAWAAHATGADIFMNFSETEGFCIVVAEAMLAGLPVIATDVGGIRDYGEAGRNVLKLAAPSAESICANILRLANDQDLRHRLGRTARSDMLRSYSAAALRGRAKVIFGPS